MKLLAWPDMKREINVSFRFPGGDPPGVGPARRPSQPSTALTTPRPTMIKSQGDSNLCASISVSNVLSYALRRYLLEENVIPDRDHWKDSGLSGTDGNGTIYGTVQIICRLIPSTKSKNQPGYGNDDKRSRL